MEKECCRKCKYHVKGEIPGEGDWICNNGEAQAVYSRPGFPNKNIIAAAGKRGETD